MLIYFVLKIRVNTFNPGPVNTGFGAPSVQAAKEAGDALKEIVKKQALECNIGKKFKL